MSKCLCTRPLLVIASAELWGPLVLHDCYSTCIQQRHTLLYQHFLLMILRIATALMHLCNFQEHPAYNSTCSETQTCHCKAACWLTLTILLLQCTCSCPVAYANGPDSAPAVAPAMPPAVLDDMADALDMTDTSSSSADGSSCTPQPVPTEYEALSDVSNCFCHALQGICYVHAAVTSCYASQDVSVVCMLLLHVAMHTAHARFNGTCC